MLAIAGALAATSPAGLRWRDVVWRDEEMKPRSCGSGANQVNRAPAVHLPAFDPGQDIADRWRKKFCSQGKADDAKIRKAAGPRRKARRWLGEGVGIVTWPSSSGRNG